MLDDSSPRSQEGNSIRVAIRCRPFNARELSEESGGQQALDFTDDAVTLSAGATYEGRAAKTFGFDHVFRCEVEQAKVFEAIGAPLIDNALSAYNGCIFAYGQTGSGKSHSVIGDPGSEEGKGILPRACERLFALLAEREEADSRFRADVLASYLEIYNEKVHDLLSRDASGDLQVRLHPQLGPIVVSLVECPMGSFAEALELFNLGARRRAVGTTQMNASSSRSHAVFSIQVRMNVPTAGGLTESQAKVHFVDLAGSEKQKKTGASGTRLKEGIGINQSLTTLGRVISDLSKPGSKAHVPFRDSKLTLLLRDALMGNSRTALLACISPSKFNLEESVSTLEFATRCKLVKTSARKNEQSRVDIIKKLEAEKDAIEHQLQQEKSQSEDLCRKLQLELEKAEEKQRAAEAALQEKNKAEDKLKELEELRQQHQLEQSENARLLKEKEKLLAEARQDRESLLKENQQLMQIPRTPSPPPEGEDAAGHKSVNAEELRELMEEEKRKQQERERELQSQMDALRNVQDSLELDQASIEARREEQHRVLEAERAKLGILGGVDLADVPGAPRLVNLHPDPSLKGCLVYHLPVGETTVGSDPERCQVRLSGLGVISEVCVLDNADNERLTVRAASAGLVRVNGIAVREEAGQKLRDGDRLAVGRAFIFQVQIPRAAEDSAGAAREAESDFERAMDEIWAGAEVDPQWESGVQRAVLLVRSDLGTEAANRLLTDAKRASEEIAKANLLVTEMPGGWIDGVRKFELSVMFGSSGLPKICVVARRHPSDSDDSAGPAAGIWELDQFVEDRLPSMHEALINMDSQASCPRLQDWEARVWSEVSVDGFKALAAQLEVEQRARVELLAQVAALSRRPQMASSASGGVARMLVPRTVRKQLSSVKSALRDMGQGSPSEELQPGDPFAPSQRTAALGAAADLSPPLNPPRSWNTGRLRAVGEGLKQLGRSSSSGRIERR